jgi:hypothetical protein
MLHSPTCSDVWYVALLLVILVLLLRLCLLQFSPSPRRSLSLPLCLPLDSDLFFLAQLEREGALRDREAALADALRQLVLASVVVDDVYRLHP